MHALVTGSSGFLGGRLVEHLLAASIEVTVLVRPSSALPPAWADRPGIRIVRAALTAGLPADPDPAVRSALASVTHIFHCAGCSTDWAPRQQFEDGNVWSTVAMLGLAILHTPKLDRFVHVSTTDVYGYPERAGNETTPRRDAGLPYNRSKLRAEERVWQAGAAGLPLTVVRPASIYGPGGKAFFTDIATLLRQRLMLLVDGGCSPGGFVYIDDVCAGLLGAATRGDAAGQAYNLSSIDGTTWRRYTQVLAEALRLPAPWLQLPFRAAMGLAIASELPHRAGFPGRPLLTQHGVYLLGRDQQYNTDKARHQLGWLPQTTLEVGIERSLASLPLRA